MNNVVKKSIKFIAIVIGLLLSLLLLLMFSLRLPKVQNIAKDKLVNFLEQKIGTDVHLDYVFVDFPKNIVFKELHLEGEDVDTLLYAKQLEVGLDIMDLLKNRATIQSINLDGLTTNIEKDEDGTFNFDYILDQFATPQSTKQKKEAKPFIISLDKIQLDNIQINFNDQQIGRDLQTYFKHFDTRIKKFDLEENSYAFSKINLDGLKVSLEQTIVEKVAQVTKQKVDSLSQQQPLQLDFTGFSLTDIDILYDDKNSKTYSKVVFDILNTDIKKIDLQENSFNINHFLLENADIDLNLHLVNNNNNTSTSDKKNATSLPTFILNKGIIDNVKLNYNNTAENHSTGLDPNHLDFSELNIDVRNFEMQNGELTGKLKSAKIYEKSGLAIQQLQSNFTYTNKEASLKNLYLKTPRTILRDKVVLKYASQDELTNNLGAVQVNLAINNSTISFQDILTLAPQLRNNSPFNNYPNETLAIDTRMVGSVNNLIVKHLKAKGFNGTTIDLSGQIQNALQTDQLHYDLGINQFESTAQTIERFLPANTLPENINLPKKFALNGKAKGNLKVVNADLTLNSSLGNITAKADIDRSIKGKEGYVIDATTESLKLGQFIGNKDLGVVTGTLQADGRGFEPNTLNAKISGHLQTFGYNQYNYEGVKLDGTVNNGQFDVALLSNDTNANLNLTAKGTYDEKKPVIQLEGNITQLNVHALNFTDQQLIFAGNINADFSNANPNDLNGTLKLNHFAVSNEKETYPIDSLVFMAKSTIDSNIVQLNAPLVDATVKGKFQLTQIGNALTQTVNEYYSFQEKKADSLSTVIDQKQFFTVEAQLYNDQLVQKFMPSIKGFEPITIKGGFDADKNKIELVADVPYLEYENYKVNEAKLNVGNKSDALNYSVTAKNAKSESLQIDQLILDGAIANNEITYHLQTHEKELETVAYDVAGIVAQDAGTTSISLDQLLVLNGMQWSVEAGNMIQLNDNGVYVHDVVLAGSGSKITAQSQGNNAGSPIDIRIQNFKISTISEMVSKDTLIADGVINGTAELRNPTKNLSVNADLKVSNLKVYGEPIGTATAIIQSEINTPLDINIGLTGNNNDLTLNGTYNLDNQQADLQLNVNQLMMKTVEAFSANQIEEAEGYLSGNLSIKGKPSKPNLDGQLRFNNAGLFVTQLGSRFQNINEKILFNQKGIEFDQFTISDSKKNNLIIDGLIKTSTYQDYAFDLTVKANDFRVIDSENTGKNMMYGILAVNTDLVIGGDIDLPIVNGTMKVTDKTSFTFVLPQSSVALQSREGVVEFIDFSQIELKENVQTESIPIEKTLKGLDVSMNIEIDQEALLSLIVDRANGDFIELRGEGQLTGGIDPSGKTTLVGTYSVLNGAYELSLGVIDRRFDIQKGSSITWEGSPTEARLNITAVYATEAAPVDLISQQISGLTKRQYNQYKQRLPIDVLLNMHGELLKPVIEFDITTEKKNSSVSDEVLNNLQAKLRQVRQDNAEMNKQVFALLLLNRFIGENPFNSKSGLSAEGFARQSVSKILSEQLNNLAGDLIEGVDLNFDLDSSEDYTSGQRKMRTDLNVNLSKKLLNDRLTVKIGSDFGIEGEARANEQTTNIAGDISVEYALSEDGKYILNAYRKNEYQVALQGQIIETGVAFIITLQYNDFKEILERRKENKQLKNNN